MFRQERVLLVLGIILVLLLAPSGWAQEAKQKSQPRAYLGILVGPAGGGEQGVLVREVTPDSPAAQAGLKSGDHIIKIGDEEVKGVDDFLQRIASRKAGEKLTLQVRRGDQEQKIMVTLGERPEPAGGSPYWPALPGGRRPAFLGVQAQPLTPELKKRLQVEADAGAVVTEVVPNSPAAKAGLKPDDIISAVDDRTIQDPAQLREAIQQAGPGKEVTLRVVRGKENLSVKATLREGAFGLFLTPGDERFPMSDVESMVEAGRRVRDLERRVEELEARVRELEKKQGRK
jgi:S1-C subfamily serine protease